MGTSRQFSREFKLEAVKLVKERGVTIAHACRDLDVHESRLRAWIREFAADPQQAFPGKSGHRRRLPRDGTAPGIRMPSAGPSLGSQQPRRGHFSDLSKLLANRDFRLPW
ncbi:transposase [Burkholderiales bacterium JOSHI_001]|nr:transposase [Burkholderiales bacterium JOSHI_001]